ncbi:MAG TPA: LLM class flavin-dependent oxidoreductase [Lacunisphaera sp.]|jgi:luciferase family oxidoreductase group 1
MIPFSVLDLAPVADGSKVAQAFDSARDLAQRAEKLGYKRYWLAEHHNMPGIASAATALVISHVAAGTSTIRVGSGGIMLPNHSPLVIAEQFGTLDALYPGRIDLGLGRAPGTDQPTSRALRRGRSDNADTFPQDVQELQAYFKPPTPHQQVQAVPGAGQAVPIWLLGSSLFSAQLAAMLGLPFAFASHFAPDYLQQALELYRTQFRPSHALNTPYTMAAISIFAADTDDEAAFLFTSMQQSFVNLRRGKPGLLPTPVRSMDGRWNEVEQRGVEHAFSEAIVGSPSTIKTRLQRFLARTQVDELMVTAAIHDHTARVRSFELVAAVRNSMTA